MESWLSHWLAAQVWSSGVRERVVSVCCIVSSLPLTFSLDMSLMEMTSPTEY